MLRVHCGAANQPDHRFCTTCGRATEAPAPSASNLIADKKSPTVLGRGDLLVHRTVEIGRAQKTMRSDSQHRKPITEQIAPIRCHLRRYTQPRCRFRLMSTGSFYLTPLPETAAVIAQQHFVQTPIARAGH